MSLAVELRVTPDRIAGREERVSVQVSVANHGQEVADPGIVSSRLLIDGEPSPAWSFAISNGARDVRERELPPGEQVETRRELRAAFLGEAGEHRLVLETGGVRSDPVTVALSGS